MFKFLRPQSTQRGSLAENLVKGVRHSSDQAQKGLEGFSLKEDHPKHQLVSEFLTEASISGWSLFVGHPYGPSHGVIVLASRGEGEERLEFEISAEDPEGTEVRPDERFPVGVINAAVDLYQREISIESSPPQESLPLRDPRVDPQPGDVLDDDPPMHPLTVVSVTNRQILACRYTKMGQNRGWWKGTLLIWRKEMSDASVLITTPTKKKSGVKK